MLVTRSSAARAGLAGLGLAKAARGGNDAEVAWPHWLFAAPG